MHTTSTFRRLFAWVAVAVCVGPVWRADAAPPLADRMPRGSLLYVGWAGTEDVAGYDASHLRRLVDAGNLPRLVTATLPQYVRRLTSDDRRADLLAESVLELAGTLARRPTAVAFGGVAWEGSEFGPDPLPRIMLVCDAGDEAPVLRAQLFEVFNRLGMPELAVFLDEVDGFVYFRMGYTGLEAASAAAGENLSGLNAFTAAFADLHDAPAVSLFVDVPEVLAFLQDASERNDGPAAAARLRQAAEWLGVDGLTTAAGTWGFDGPSWASAGVVGIDGEATGLLRLLDGPGVDATLASLVPGDATVFQAVGLDLAPLLDVVKDAVARFSPENANQIDMGLFFLNVALGANVEQGLLRASGPAWGVWTSPATGNTVSGSVVVNVPRDPSAMRRAMTGVSMNGLRLAADPIRNAGLVPPQGRREKVGDVDVYHLLPGPADAGTWPDLLRRIVPAPAWTADDRALWLGPTPQTIADARAAGAGGRFADTDAWTSATSRDDEGDTRLAGFEFLDLPRLADRAYPSLLADSQRLLTQARAMDLDAPGTLLPPLHVVKAELHPLVTVVRRDDRGWHWRRTEPFPLSGLLAGDRYDLVADLVRAAVRSREE